jgi:hypothetical protein
VLAPEDVWLFALEDSINIAGGAPELVDEVGPIRHQAACSNVISFVINRWQLEVGRKLDDQIAMNHRKPTRSQY